MTISKVSAMAFHSYPAAAVVCAASPGNDSSSRCCRDRPSQPIDFSGVGRDSCLLANAAPAQPAVLVIAIVTEFRERFDFSALSARLDLADSQQARQHVVDPAGGDDLAFALPVNRIDGQHVIAGVEDRDEFRAVHEAPYHRPEPRIFAEPASLGRLSVGGRLAVLTFQLGADAAGVLLDSAFAVAIGSPLSFPACVKEARRLGAATAHHGVYVAHDFGRMRLPLAAGLRLDLRFKIGDEFTVPEAAGK